MAPGILRHRSEVGYGFKVEATKNVIRTVKAARGTLQGVDTVGRDR